MLNLTIIRLFYGILLLFIALSIHSASAAPISPDYPREQRWADEVVPTLLDSQAIYLTQDNGHQFLSLLAENPGYNDRNLNVALLVVHGMGIHPNWGMMSNLRLGLHDYGYTTLSIQMPILAKNASYKDYPSLFPDAADRLHVASSYLIKKGYRNVIIVSHSNGSRMSRTYMLNNPSHIAAWVAISLTQGDTFNGINAPVFDLYGENDLSHVIEYSEKRKESFKQNIKSQQLIIPEANHFFASKENAMVTAIKNYLNQIAF